VVHVLVEFIMVDMFPIWICLIAVKVFHVSFVPDISCLGFVFSLGLLHLVVFVCSIYTVLG
jgi:hypothetical protein